MKTLVLLALISLSLTNVHGMGFKEARKKGIVVEQADGYLKAAAAQGKAIAAKVNAKRKKAYMKIAKKTGTDLKTVETQAAKKIKAKLKK